MERHPPPIAPLDYVMELDKLNSRAMLSLSEYWLQEPFMRARFRDNDLGVALRIRLREVYGDLTELYAPHLVYGIRSLELAMDLDSAGLQALAQRVYIDLGARIEAARTPASARRIRHLKEMLFPGDIPSLTTPDPVGVARHLSRGQRPTPADAPWFTRLRSVEVGEGKLMDAYRAWAVIEDRRSHQARRRGVYDVSGRTFHAAAKVRHKWLGVALALYAAIPLMSWTDAVRMRMFQLLEESVATTVRRVMSGAESTDLPRTLQGELQGLDDFDENDTLDYDPDAFEVFEEPAGPHPPLS